MIRVHIDVGSAVTRAGLEALLQDSTEIAIVHSAAEADVVLLDQLPARRPALPSVIISENSAPRGMRAGAAAALPSSAGPEQIVAAIYAAAAGLAAVPIADAADLFPAPVEEAAVEPLTPRELEVLEMLAEGLSNKLIAYRLNISAHTAKFHVNAILAKLGAGTRTEAVMRGIRLGLVKV